MDTLEDPQDLGTPTAPLFDHLGQRSYLAQGSCLRVLQGVEDQFFDAIITDPPYSSGGLHRSERIKDPGEKYKCTDYK